jgi:uncharacterized protein (TIGR03067 family)
MELVAIGMVWASLTCQQAVDPEPKGKETVKRELRKLQGTWRRVRVALEGEAKRYEHEVRITVVGDRLQSVEDGKTLSEWRIKLNPTERPKPFDLTALTVNKGKRVLGIYELAGDKLTIAFHNSGKRPRAFTSKRTGVWLEVYERVKR